MNNERRNDVGTKLTAGILMAVISIFLALIFVKTYSVAEGANNRSYENTKDIAVINQRYLAIKEELTNLNKKMDKILNGR